MKKIALAGALALACLASPALAYDDAARPEAMVAVSMQREARVIVPLRQHMRAHRTDRRVMQARPLDIRTPTQLVAVAQRYIGSRRFTPYARAWCADALNAWLRQAGYRGTGDGRAISFARYGRPSGPKVGAIAVMRHHVGIVIGHSGRGVVLLSGNHSRRVGVGVYASHRIIAYREPT